MITAATIPGTGIMAIAHPREMRDAIPTIAGITTTAIARPRETEIMAGKPATAITIRGRATDTIIMSAGDTLPWWAPITPAP